MYLLFHVQKTKNRNVPKSQNNLGTCVMNAKSMIATEFRQMDFIEKGLSHQNFEKLIADLLDFYIIKSQYSLHHPTRSGAHKHFFVYQ